MMRRTCLNRSRSRRLKSGFTLVELLVVISILGLLIAILVPSLKGARRVSKRVVCGTNLRSIGQGMRMYLNDSNDYLPVVEYLPSLPFDEDNPRPAIATVLGPYVRKDQKIDPSLDHEEILKEDGDEVFKCPADIPGRDQRAGESRGKSYFQTENSSYCFNVHLHLLRDRRSMMEGNFDKPVKLSEALGTDFAKRIFGGNAAEEEIWLLRDYIAFHGDPGKSGSSNYLYVDGRVADLER